LPPVRACKVAWRGDGKQVMGVRGDASCKKAVAALVRLPVYNVRNQKELNAKGDDPVFQPLTLGG
jgi:hypothetical protein